MKFLVISVQCAFGVTQAVWQCNREENVKTDDSGQCLRRSLYKFGRVICV